ncbi:MAG: hypothetical protein ACI83Y_000349, partial [Candidatus Azotimanducaceae bacterium]
MALKDFCGSTARLCPFFDSLDLGARPTHRCCVVNNGRWIVRTCESRLVDERGGNIAELRHPLPNELT